MSLLVSLIADDFAGLRRRVLAQAPFADRIEVRLDRIGNPGREALAELVEACRKPLVVAVNGPEAFGSWRGGDEAAFAILRDAAAAGAEFVDVDWRQAAAFGAVEGRCRRIVSRHETEGTPARLDPLLEDLRGLRGEGDVVKIVTHARCAEDGMRVLHWLREQRETVAFCSGDAGSFTRLLAPIFGSPWTYAAAAAIGGDAPEATAPGQIPIGSMRAALPAAGVTNRTQIFGVVGNPIGHSLSPPVYGPALRGAGLDAVFAAFAPECFEDFLALAEDERFAGFSVTVPFKEEAFRLASATDEDSRRAGATNTLSRGPEGWRGANTDTIAVRVLLREGLAGISVAPDAGRVLVLGAGGAARAAAWAARSLGCRTIVAGRTAERARRLAEELGVEATAWERLGEVEYDALVHATTVGMVPDVEGCAVPVETIRPGSVVIDAVYRPRETALLGAAAQRGAHPIDGGAWFVRQAAAQFRVLTGKRADEELLHDCFDAALVKEETS